MRKLIVGLLLVLALCLLLPPVFGGMAKDRFEATLDRAAAQTGDTIDMQLVDYDRGWFSSTAQFRITFTDEFLDGNPALAVNDGDVNALREVLQTGMSQAVEINHGPVIIGENTGIGLGEVTNVFTGGESEFLTQLLAKTGNDYFIKSATTVGFSGAGQTQFDAPAFDVKQYEGFDIIFGGGQGNGTFDYATSHVDVIGKVDGLSLQRDNMGVVVTTTDFDVDMAAPEDAPYGTGTAEVTVSSVTVQAPDQSGFDIENFSMDMVSEQSANKQGNVRVSYKVASATDGADFNLNDIELTLHMRNIDGPAFSALQKASNALPTADTTATNADLTPLKDPVYDLLKGGAGLSIEPLKFTLDDQRFEAKIAIDTKADNLPQRQAFTLDNPLIFINLFALDLDLVVDRELAVQAAIPQLKQQLAAGIPEGTEVSEAELHKMAASQAPLMLTTMTAQGFLKEEGDNYRVSAKYDNGAVTINGNPLSLSQFINAD